MNRLSCVRCGDSIHPDTAAAHNGLCMPCVRGNTRSIQERQAERQRQREAERAYEASPERQYWLALVRQVYDPDRGFDTLGLGDRQYWLIKCCRARYTTAASISSSLTPVEIASRKRWTP